MPLRISLAGGQPFALADSVSGPAPATQFDPEPQRHGSPRRTSERVRLRAWHRPHIHRAGAHAGSLIGATAIPAIAAVAGAPTAGTFRTANADLPWRLNDYAGALAQAQHDHKPVFIHFTGYTCTNCRWMEANMFPRTEIRAALAHFVLARLFTDGDGAVYEQQQTFQEQHFHTVALPLYAIMAPDGSAIATFPGLTHNPCRVSRLPPQRL